MNILIIDDQTMIIRILKAKITVSFQKMPEALVLKTARTLSDARAIIDSSFTPDLLICDINLENELGPEIFPYVREKSPRCFICLMSGSNEPLSHTADQFVNKVDLLNSLGDILLTAAFKKSS